MYTVDTEQEIQDMKILSALVLVVLLSLTLISIGIFTVSGNGYPFIGCLMMAFPVCGFCAKYFE